MTSVGERPASPALERLLHVSSHHFAQPTKKINDGDDLAAFFTSKAYRDLTVWLFQLTRAMFPDKQDTGAPKTWTLNLPPPYSPELLEVRTLLQSLSTLIDQAPPETGPRRFGNVAFRKWHQLAESNAPSLLESCLKALLPTHIDADSKQVIALRDELKAYFLASFGSPQRLDYGTGHELSFLAFLGCIWKLGVFHRGDEQAIVIGLIQP